MAKPVIFDDGGSIRIRELDDGKNMDGLIGSPNGFTSTTQQFFDGATASAHNHCYLLFRSAAETGGLTKSDPVQLTINSTVTITAADNQIVTVKFDTTTGKMIITLPGSASGSQHGKRRWYLMPSDLIQSVAYTGATTSPTSGTLTPASPASTMVHFVDQLPALLETVVKAKKPKQPKS